MQADLAMPNSEDSLMQAKQPPTRNAIPDQFATDAKGDELTMSNHAVLLLGKLTNGNGRNISRCNAFPLRWNGKALHLGVGGAAPGH